MVTPLVLLRERIAAPRSAKPGLHPALLLAVAAVHAALITASCLLIVDQPAPPPPPEPGLQIVFTQPAPPAPSTTALAAATLESQSLPLIATLSPVPPIAVVQGAAPPHTRTLRPAPRHSATTPTTRTTQPEASTTMAPPAAPTARPAPAAPPQRTTPAALAGWEARIRQAVQDAAIYPASARLQRRQGRAQVQFAYATGAVSAVTVTQSSQSTLLDAAARAAVTRAKMPPPPPEIGPQNRIMLVWVQFTLTAED